MTIDAVLFDADGVLQRPTVDWRGTLTGLVPPGRDADAFVADLLAAEQPTITGREEFAGAVAAVLDRWQLDTPVEQVLGLWDEFAAVPEVVAIVQALRAAGIGCHLATNQHAYRRAAMQDRRGYGAWFDRTFYSCDLGVAKPDPAYFRAILADLALPPASVLFVDDNPANVAGARETGLVAEEYDLSAGVPALTDLLRRHGLPVPA